MVLGLSYLGGMMAGILVDETRAEMIEAIAQCEKDLARSQTCGYTIQTYIKEVK